MEIVKETTGKNYTGRCHCGDVQIAMKGPFYPFVICHCTDCLRLAGYSWSAAKLHHSQLSFTKGAENVDWYASSDFAKRGFCKSCHAQMFFRLNDSDILSISVGMFDHYDGMQTKGHIYRGDMPDCCHRTDDLPDIDDVFYPDSD